ncbi:CYTH and CHAD domain-containing protein [Mycobacterium sp. CBMA293]|nr:CYTH and CHAD domain-containing protein [Mycolicibacterium sp. CBMA 360]MUL60224.1 CYTH and CHAD domain-containing protein [Mycolicibacterium sp. CBMA 335]MUL71564.1 CYTH and CHAD domain-containing protein [Mycolicibacterium sp. CBMA 311]MUL96014.1 CYTH and CHAD domain-containing protein [Mycolicibacterium sp. CBMA 230]MUM14162.1 CYTH and CHAD domain-containing protein [Mycolicibacterium sp. CBMA 293]
MKVNMAAGKRKPSRHTEIERKFAVVDSTVAPSFDGLSAVGRVEQLPVAHLDAVYFDTSDHDLAAHKITLRRRTGGTDAGWHLKLPAGADARTEVRLPLTGAREGVPDELHDIVLAIVRDRPLHPVARIETERTVFMLYGPDDTAVAEFCDDRVTATAGESLQNWREWELELAGSTSSGADALDRLANRLFDAGAEPAGHGSKLAKVLAAAQSGDRGDDTVTRSPEPTDKVHRAIAAHVAELISWDRAVRADAFDSVHQMRVTIRKIRSLLQGTGNLGDRDWVLDELKLLAGVLGTARDAEVLAQRYEHALGGLAPELVRGQVHERLVDGSQRRYQSGLRRSLTAMRSERYFRLLDALDAIVVDGSQPAAAEEDAQPVTVGGAYRRVRKSVRRAEGAEAAGADDSDEALHRIRKGAKRLRYTAAAMGESKVADCAKDIQTLLGDHQDSYVSRAHLVQQADAAHTAGEDTFTYGILHQQEAEVAEDARLQLDAALKALARAMSKVKK